MKTVGVIFGGVSTEHNVSIVSGTSVASKIDTKKYNVKQIYIAKDGTWYEHKESVSKTKVGDTLKNLQKIENVMEYLKTLDVAFPVLHGKNGEDGTIQGLFEMVGVPYVGCKVLASAIGMDKAYTKIIFAKAGIPQANCVYTRKFNDKYIYIGKNFEETIYSLEDICDKIMEELRFPVFVKPSNSGSSVGISKAKKKEELSKALEEAAKFDNKIVIEQGINGRELECAVLGNEEVSASGVGEILAADEFYSFDAKYHNEKSETIIPADIPEEIKKKIQYLAIKAFKAIDGKGLSRVDFFLENETNQIYINEINTLPGFTSISMYSKLWEHEGKTYEKLIEELIDLA